VASTLLRELARGEAERIAEIDRSEQIRIGYRVEDGVLRSEAVAWDVPRWTRDATGEPNLGARIRQLANRLEAGDRVIGAFDGELLVGYIALHALGPKLAQLAELFVSNGYRRQGIASRLTAALLERARASGARQLYVSAVPSESAVGFYRSQGFRLAEQVHPDLFCLEPEDIHMIREL
jgi:ribosomal protein S18 acetylase RimI-like enzyme